MTPERWRHITTIFHGVMACDAERRDDFLSRAAAADPELRREVESLLAGHQAAGSFGDRPLSRPGVTLELGTAVGPYRIAGLLGVGGMGEVYRAHDPRLGRDVAVKILPPHLTRDPQRLARFERESRMLASLNHPGIGAIYGVEEFAGGRALVMELIDGEDLVERLARGPIPLADALPIARLIAEALDAAHDRGVIHRDLHPGNIKLRPDGTVKVLDFGLAKAIEAANTASASDQPLAAPGPTPPITEAGMILGTTAYMSPEQAKGRPADQRADIWAFGVVLFEMLSGQRLFTGETLSDTLASVLKTEPDWRALPADTPPPLARLLRWCLRKDPKRRLQAIGDARVQIDDLLGGFAEEPIAARPQPPRRQLIAVASVLFIAGAVVAALSTLVMTRRVHEAPSRFAILFTPGQPLNVSGPAPDLAFSNDGRQLVYRLGGSNSAGSPLAVRRLDQLDAHQLPSISAAYAPFFSPDGQWIGFFEDAELRKAAIAGGPTITLCRVTGRALGASWGDDNMIVFATDDRATGLLRVSGNGGEPSVLTTKNAVLNETDHEFPSVLPGSASVLFTISEGRADNAQVEILDVKSGRRKTLVRGSQAGYLGPSPGMGPAGYLTYVAGGSLHAVRFDADRLEILGEPTTIVDRMMIKPGGAANYALSRTGTLVYMVGAPELTSPRSLVWVDRKGHEEPIGAPLRSYGTPRLSPDGTRVAAELYDQDADIWIWNLARETFNRLTFDAAGEGMSVWTPDSRQIIFMSTRSGVSNVYRQAADGSGAVERLAVSAIPQWPTSITAEWLVGFDLPPRSGSNVVFFRLRDPAVRRTSDAAPGIRQLSPQLRDPTTFEGEFAEFSPNGRYLAYQSSQSGQSEIYVRPFPLVNDGLWQISSGGATRPAWARSGRELFYLDGSNALTKVNVETSGATFTAGRPAKLFDTGYLEPNPSRHYDVSPDGERFLMLKGSPAGDRSSAPTSIVVVLNWFEELQQKVSAASR